MESGHHNYRSFESAEYVWLFHEGAVLWLASNRKEKHQEMNPTA